MSILVRVTVDLSFKCPVKLSRICEQWQLASQNMIACFGKRFSKDINYMIMKGSILNYKSLVSNLLMDKMKIYFHVHSMLVEDWMCSHICSTKFVTPQNRCRWNKLVDNYFKDHFQPREFTGSTRKFSILRFSTRATQNIFLCRCPRNPMRTKTNGKTNGGFTIIKRTINKSIGRRTFWLMSLDYI